MSTLDVVRAELAAHDAARPRSQQVESGGSQIFGCRAESLLRLSGVPESDPREPWQAWVGTAIHAMLEAATPDGVLKEHRAVYRGVPVTVDRFDPKTKTLTDYKSKDDAAAIAKVKATGPHRQQKAQVQTGAAALRAEGCDVQTVELLYVPRAGSLNDAWLWSAPFDQALADEAADWVAEQAEAAKGFVFTDSSQLEGFRDKPESFCHAYCPYSTVCRGEEERGGVLDERLTEIAQSYFDAKTREAEAKNEASAWRKDLEGVHGQAGELTVRWQGGNTKTSVLPDTEKALAEYEALIGPLPTREVTTTSSLSLYVTKAKPQAGETRSGKAKKAAA